MYRADLKPDPLEQESIRRRQLLEQERKKRFFDPRTRCLGIDIESLQDQIHQKETQRTLAKNYETWCANYTKDTCDVLNHLDEHKRTKTQKELLSLVEYRQHNQQPSTRREWDLNDPKRLLRDQPARVGDNDPRLSVSGLQKFDGEDLKGKERDRFQKLQLRAWAYQGRLEKEKMRQEEEARRQAEKEYMEAMEARRQELVELEKNIRKEKDEQVKELNMKLAAEKKAREEAQAKVRGDVNTLVIPAMADLTLDRPHIWKYMPGTQRQAILREEQEAKEEAQRRKNQQQKEAAEWYQQSMAIMKATELLEQKKRQAEKEKAKQIAMENLRKAEEDRQRQHILNRVVYTNKPSADYFAQFNTSSR